MKPEAPVLYEHERSWSAYFRGIDSKTNDHKDPNASAWRGFRRWVRGWFYRGYATEDDGTPYAQDSYLSPWAPDELRAHEAGHTPSFCRAFLIPEHPNGPFKTAVDGLDHEPFSTLDIMLPGYFSPFRLHDEREIEKTYNRAVQNGRVVRLVEA